MFITLFMFKFKFFRCRLQILVDVILCDSSFTNSNLGMRNNVSFQTFHLSLAPFVMPKHQLFTTRHCSLINYNNQHIVQISCSPVYHAHDATPATILLSVHYQCISINVVSTFLNPSHQINEQELHQRNSPMHNVRRKFLNQ